MSSTSIHQDTAADHVGAAGQWHTHQPARCYVTLSIGPDSVSIHFADLKSANKLYQQLGNVVAQLHDERAQGDEGIDLSADAPPPGGIIGIQPGSPTMDVHGPTPTRHPADALANRR